MKRMDHLGVFIKKARNSCKMTQRELAAKLGCTSQFVANWERGASRPPKNMLPKIRVVLNLTEREFISFLIKESLQEYKEIFRK